MARVVALPQLDLLLMTACGVRGQKSRLIAERAEGLAFGGV